MTRLLKWGYNKNTSYVLFVVTLFCECILGFFTLFRPFYAAVSGQGTVLGPWRVEEVLSR